MKISRSKVTTVAVPVRGELLSSDGAAPRSLVKHVVELHTDDGLIGLGEAGPRVSAAQMQVAGKVLCGEDPFNLERVRHRLQSDKFYRMDLATISAAYETACLDLQGRHIGRPVADLLGGLVRDSIPLNTTLYRRNGYGEYPSVLSPEELVNDAEKVITEHGFKTIKFKAGSCSPREDLRVVRLLRERFPHHNLRVDPNGVWSVETAIRMGQKLLDYDLEWVEDPTLGIAAMAEFCRHTPIPVATNMCCIQPRDFPATVSAGAANVILLDCWYLGGPWHARQMAAICEAFGVGVGVHSGGGSAELGIGLAAELHLAASLPALVHASDSLHHQLAGDVIKAGAIVNVDGSVKVPVRGGGLGVELEEDELLKWAAEYEKLTENLEKLYPTYPQY